jgi:hypothetical protein
LIDCEEDRTLRVLVGMLRLEPLKAKAANKEGTLEGEGPLTEAFPSFP